MKRSIAIILARFMHHLLQLPHVLDIRLSLIQVVLCLFIHIKYFISYIPILIAHHQWFFLGQQSHQLFVDCSLHFDQELLLFDLFLELSNLLLQLQLFCVRFVVGLGLLAEWFGGQRGLEVVVGVVVDEGAVGMLALQLALIVRIHLLQWLTHLTPLPLRSHFLFHPFYQFKLIIPTPKSPKIQPKTHSTVNNNKSLQIFFREYFYLFQIVAIKKMKLKSTVVLLVLVAVTLAIPYKMKLNRPIEEAVISGVDIVGQQQLHASKSTNTLWPLPKSIQLNTTSTPLTISPCKINYKISSPSNPIIQQIISIYLTQVFKCAQQPMSNITLAVVVKNVEQMVATNVTQEKYSLIIRSSNTWELTADYYVGFLRGFQTFSQLFQQTLSTDNLTTQYVIKGIPIVIDDQPDYLWRGLMIDSSRHFQPISVMKKMIDGLMFNKMNVLHWHITDEDSFPMEIGAVPELAQAGAVGGVYTMNDVKGLIQYAKTRGVRLIPQFDTPAHTQAWGRSKSLSDIIVNCNTEYKGQFDPTLPLTYDTIRKVMQHINTTFTDNYVHFGGDQISMPCWDNRPQIKTRMAQMNITDYKSLQIYYRQQQKKIWRSISKNKKAIYWANEEIDLPLDNDDVIHWWGMTKNVDKLKGRPNEVILSNYDLTYLDVGFGSRYGNSYGVYQNWRQLYTSFTPKIQGVNVIGGQTCMWSQIANPFNIETKVWIRTSALAEKLWSSSISIAMELNNIATRLHAQSERMRARGFKVSPVTVGLCEKDMGICF